MSVLGARRNSLTHQESRGLRLRAKGDGHAADGSRTATHTAQRGPFHPETRTNAVRLGWPQLVLQTGRPAESTHAHTHMCTHRCIHTHSHVHTTHTLTCTPDALAHTCTPDTHTHVCTQTHTTHMRQHTHSNVHTRHTHMHRHTCISNNSLAEPSSCSTRAALLGNRPPGPPSHLRHCPHDGKV